MKNVVEPCSGMCCPRKESCRHYDIFLEYRDKGKFVTKYVCNGMPSRCYGNAYKNYEP